MDPPGPFETGSTKAYFNVTLPEKVIAPLLVVISRWLAITRSSVTSPLRVASFNQIFAVPVKLPVSRAASGPGRGTGQEVED